MKISKNMDTRHLATISDTLQYLCSLKCPGKIHFNTQYSRGGGGAQCALLTRELISGYPMIYGEHEPKIAPLALLFFPMIIGSTLIQGVIQG